MNNEKHFRNFPYSYSNLYSRINIPTIIGEPGEKIISQLFNFSTPNLISPNMTSEPYSGFQEKSPLTLEPSLGNNMTDYPN